MRRFFLVMFVSSTGVIGVSCTAPPSFVPVECDPDSFFPAPECIDGGTDAGSDAPDAEPQAACTSQGGECVEIPDDPEAGFWSQVPWAVWFGPAADMPKECPFVGGEQLRLYAGLTAPPAQCDPCECQEATGQCSGVPGAITIGAGMCGAGGAPSLPFDGPGGWEGSCTGANALPAGAQCPPGSGVPCAQSITFSALPPPANETCGVKPSQIIKVGGTKSTEWETGALACRSSLDSSLCGAGDQLCIPKVHYPHRQCLWREGKHTKCPKPYDYEGPRVMYPFQPKESRECTECMCGAPQGGMCMATVRLFDDGVCSNEFHQRIVTSEDSPCDPILPAGRAIGGKSVTENVYVKGTCEAGGGEPIGEAVEDEENAVTFCCRPSYMFDE
ncbi:hypothetical protein [Polyangium mundeleinium]|uniref:Uncharacterized protein n=1 Tax=Polyangium mundeleinium TaxID=2995306 RepID=A0ABT5EWF6_9BACT|nr:hypothetical protein [Polyangium mundeleinium]MDC0746145.1 hypothetical protein [Polyangium mundeleinium]